MTRYTSSTGPKSRSPSLAQLAASLTEGAKATDLPSLVRIDVTGSALPPAVHAMVRERLCEDIYSQFGTTELGAVAVSPMHAAGQARAVGWVVPGVEIEATDEEFRPLPPGETGLLRARSALGVQTCREDDAATTRAFRDGWFYAGDIGAVSSDGLVTLTGSASTVTNAGGLRVSPHTVEDVLLKVPGVIEAVAFGVPDRMGILRVWAAIVASRTVPPTELNDACRTGLGQQAPKFVLQLKGIPRNANGKIAREQLVAFAASQQP